ncbi:MAG: aldehyde dehydrogenase [Spirochaetes bacterium]|nr:MAG: aldehyde dehydrogenase [Spirochaetota bacterium]
MVDDIKEMYKRARKAFEVVEFWPQEKVDEMVAAVGWMLQKDDVAKELGTMAAEETKMGIAEHKIAKQKSKVRGAMWDMKGVKTCGLVREDKKKGLRIYAKPIGVIANVTPVTNPTATPSFLGLNILKTRNAMIVSPHPRAKRCTYRAVEYGRKALKKIGAPEDLWQCIKEPNNQKTQELMKNVDFVIATGGAALIKVVYAAGKPAHTVGAGNVVSIIDESADVKEAANKIMRSKTFDNATSCSSENAVAIHENIYDDMINALMDEGGYMCSLEEREKLRKLLWPDGESLNRDVIAKSATFIAEKAGFHVPAGTRFLMVHGEKIGPEDRFSGEKLSVVLTVWKWNDFSEMVERMKKMHKFSGEGHSASIHTKKQEQIEELSIKANVGRVEVNMPHCLVNSGSWYNGQPFTTTIGCGTWAGNMTSDNINYRHMLNYTWTSVPVPEYVPTDEELFGDYIKKWGRD